MNHYRLNELDSNAFDSVLESHRENFHNKLQETDATLLAFDKLALLALKAVGVKDLDVIRSGEEFTLSPFDNDHQALGRVEKPELVWDKITQDCIHKNLLDCINLNDDRSKAIKEYIDWHESTYTELLYDNDIGGKDALFDYVYDQNLWFNEDGEEVPAPVNVED